MPEVKGSASQATRALLYKYTRSDGVYVTTFLEAGKANIMEVHGEGGLIKLLERSQLTCAEMALLNEVNAID